MDEYVLVAVTVALDVLVGEASCDELSVADMLGVADEVSVGL